MAAGVLDEEGQVKPLVVWLQNASAAREFVGSLRVMLKPEEAWAAGSSNRAEEEEGDGGRGMRTIPGWVLLHLLLYNPQKLFGMEGAWQAGVARGMALNWLTTTEGLTFLRMMVQQQFPSPTVAAPA